MKTKHQITISALLTLMLTSTRPEAMEVRQELYRFRMTMTQDVTNATFLITDQRQLQEKPSIGLWLPLVHFKLNSAVLSPAGADIILSGLKQYGITGKRPLTVTGYTCMLGSEKFNQKLSQKRADGVATFLRDHGFVVAIVQGQGANNPITYNIQEFYKNRRVEISTYP
jgi:outer membrane protein OmpA-like peptidoglycan-associated protein